MSNKLKILYDPLNCGHLTNFLRELELTQVEVGRLYLPERAFKSRFLRTTRDTRSRKIVRRFLQKEKLVRPFLGNLRDHLKTIQRMPSRKIALTPASKGVESLLDFEFKEGDLLVFGHEHRGIPRNALQYVDYRVTIPQKQFRNGVRPVYDCLRTEQALSMVLFAYQWQRLQKPAQVRLRAVAS